LAKILMAWQCMVPDRFVRRSCAIRDVRCSWIALAVVHAGCLAASSEPSTATVRGDLDEVTGSSEMVTWTCTDSPCPWGISLANPAIAWPVVDEPVGTRLGYTASPAPYLPADQATGAIISIDAGTASVYAGEPSADSHRWITTLSTGQSYQVAGLAAGEVLSVQADSDFDYHVTPGPPADPGPPPAPSQTATWTCTDSPCPWGDSSTGEALVWPADAGALDTRLGYTVSPAIYLPAARANGAHIAIVDGTASAYAGRPDDSSHRWLATLSAGQSLDVAGLVDGEVLSVQADAPFTYQLTFPDPTDPGPGGDVVDAIAALWRCNVPECTGDPWTGAVINWPSWAAYQSNARAGDQSRSVFADDDTPLYPYMGAWAEGCQVTAVAGTVLVIEWERGTDTWRETWLEPPESHVIHLVAPENSAMIETDDGISSFRVSLQSCTPQPLP
jgi:hypothetical protein